MLDGPLWLMLSAAVSAAAQHSITAVVVAYRVCGAVLHLITAGVLWTVLRRERPDMAVAGTVCYAWNPLVLLEVVGNAHNDVLVALCAALLVAAGLRRCGSRPRSPLRVR